MKKIILILAVLYFSVSTYSQSPVKWIFSSRSIGDNVYELRYTAKIEAPWHIYSQSTPDGGPLPTKITLSKNPLLTVEGKAKEIGKLHTKHEEVFEVDVKFFNEQVDFIQVVKIKSKVKTVAKGVVEFMLCNEEQCLPPTEVAFSINL